MTVDHPSFHAAADALAGDGWGIVDDLRLVNAPIN